MKKLANHGTTVLCTIHQPSSEIFENFTQLTLLANGRLAFCGSQTDGIEFFNK
jgi:ABC-type multidrug transport system ATPase subunit